MSVSDRHHPPSLSVSASLSLSLCQSSPKTAAPSAHTPAASKPDVVPGHCPERWVWGPGAELPHSPQTPLLSWPTCAPSPLYGFSYPSAPDAGTPHQLRKTGSSFPGPPGPWPPTPSPHPEAYSLNTRHWVSVLPQIQTLPSPPPGSPRTLPCCPIAGLGPLPSARL